MRSKFRPRLTTRRLMGAIAVIALALGLSQTGLNADVVEFGGILASTAAMVIVFVTLYFALWLGVLGLFWVYGRYIGRQRAARS